MKMTIAKASLSLAILAGTGVYTIPQTYASTTETQVQPSNQQIELANTINSHLTKEGQHLKIKNPLILSAKLKKISSDVSLKDVTQYVNTFNNVLDGKEGVEKQQALKNYLNEINKQNIQSSEMTFYAKKKKIDPCKALSVVGYAHTTASAAAAVALGVSGPVGWGVVAGMGLAYTVGGLYC
ncbi:hypothetical protein [Macrococcus equipercicus]|nr:hypothetical protein [Macrococcus equipercicus]